MVGPRVKNVNVRFVHSFIQIQYHDLLYGSFASPPPRPQLIFTNSLLYIQWFALSQIEGSLNKKQLEKKISCRTLPQTTDRGQVVFGHPFLQCVLLM
jgi:hypothetical protein